MIQAIIIQNTNYLIPNKEHKNFTASNQEAMVGGVLTGEFRNINGLRKGKPFEYRLFFTNDGKILYANCVRAENVPSEILSNADNKNLDESKSSTSVNYTPYLIALGGGLAGYYYGKNKNVSGNDLIKYIVVGSVGAYGIYYFTNKNKTTIIKPIK